MMLSNLSLALQRLLGWVWAPMLAKTMMYGAAFTALAQVGSGAYAQLSPTSPSAVPPAAVPQTAVPQTAVPQTAVPQTAVPRAQPSSSAATASKRKGGCPKTSGSHGEAYDNDGRLILNLATADDLVRLPGIGRKRAEAIVALRQRMGGFRRIRDLLRIRGIGYRSLKKLRPKLTLNKPKPIAPAPSASNAPSAPTRSAAR